jgi:hypothetical protein
VSQSQGDGEEVFLMAENYQFVGTVTHFFDRISVAVVQLEADLYLEDWILVHGPRTEFEQMVRSMQIDRQPIDKGEAGEEIGLKLESPARFGDEVYLIVGDQG